MGAPEPAIATAPIRDGVAADGTITMPVQRLTFSSLASPAARRAFIHRLSDAPATSDAQVLRQHYGRFNDALAQDMLARYPVDITNETMGGVPVQRVSTRAASERGLLINLHGGGFMWGAGSGALVEAIPIAAATNLPVIAVDYRMAPEHCFPAASDDACAVYESALDRHAPTEIGLYGLSAGAVLSAQTIAALHRKSIPGPAAVAMLGGAGMDFGGDTASLGAAVMGSPADSGPRSLFDLPYMRNASPHDPLAAPECDNDVLSAFPPSLLISASRDFAGSSVTRFHRRLVANGVDARLFMFDGLWHAFHIFPELPESEEVYRIMADFFARNLRLAG